jgi:hypothetical protein
MSQPESLADGGVRRAAAFSPAVAAGASPGSTPQGPALLRGDVQRPIGRLAGTNRRHADRFSKMRERAVG